MPVGDVDARVGKRDAQGGDVAHEPAEANVRAIGRLDER